MTLYRPVDLTARLRVGPAPIGAGGAGRALVRLDLGREAEDLERHDVERLVEVLDVVVAIAALFRRQRRLELDLERALQLRDRELERALRLRDRDLERVLRDLVRQVGRAIRTAAGA